MDVSLDFPYQAEYAKSSRASCRNCKGNIEKGSLRLAVLIQSPSFDGKITHWYHCMCFFAKQKPKSIEDIGNFDSLRWEDQQKIKEKLANGGSVGAVSGSKKKKNGASKNGDFCVEYAKSGRAACKDSDCGAKILKDEIRISKKNYESETAKRFGPVPQWYHIDCFIKERNELDYFDGAEDLPGFNTLSADDKKNLREKIKKIDGKRKAEGVPDMPSKKIKSENDELLKKQSKKLHYYRDLLEKTLKKPELTELLDYNGYCSFTGVDKLLNVLSDLMTFGVIDKCEVCKEGNFVYKFGIGYICYGNLSEWTKCRNIKDDPKRKPFKVPQEFKDAFEFLKNYKFKPNGNRLITKRSQTPASNGKEESLKPLSHLAFVIIGENFSGGKQAVKAKVQRLGGEVHSKVNAMTTAVITTRDLVTETNEKMCEVQKFGIDCVPEDFLDEVESGGVALMIKKKNVAPWARDVEQRLTSSKKFKSSSKSGAKSRSKYEQEMPESVTVTLKDGNFVDPNSGLSKTCHVYKRKEKPYSVVLGLVDLVRGTNSYYKLQVLEADNKRSWFLFRSWGRIGTTIGDDKLEEMEDLQDAINGFNEVYEKKTGNKFSAKEKIKLPNFWFPLDLDHGEKATKINKPNLKDSKSKLPMAIQELVSLIFDVNSMENEMVEYELDLKKMPLGKLSSQQLEKAYNVLSEAVELLKEADEKLSGESGVASGSSSSGKSRLIDCSNRFYTLIPHDFGMKSPPLLDDVDVIKSKIEMLDNLREIEVAYSLLKCDSGSSDSALDPIDECYSKLNTDISVLDKENHDFKIIQSYVTNTHAATHTHYSLRIQEVFKIERKGEAKRFKPFKKLHNRQLLWHGSRVTNYAGILSKGLRIAPPEAPSTGYMFGKGVYFADMVSKSANYCCTSKNKPTGLLLLCDVALGDMHELKGAKNIKKLPVGKHSTKGLGKTLPDPEQTVKLDDGVEVPLGVGKPSDVKHCDLLYNEYIVYDVSQVNIKYLVKADFEYKF